MHIWAGRLHADAARDLAQVIKGVLLAGVENDAEADAAPMGVDQSVNDQPVRQRIGRDVDLCARRAKQLHIHALEVLDWCVMDLDRLGGGGPRKCQKEENPEKRENERQAKGHPQFLLDFCSPTPFPDSPSPHKNEYRTNGILSMPRRSSPSDKFVDHPPLLSTMGACREAITREMARMGVGRPLYYSASTVIASIGNSR